MRNGREPGPGPRSSRAPDRYPCGLLAPDCAASPRAATRCCLIPRENRFTTATQPNGSKLPRHNSVSRALLWRASLLALACAASPRPATRFCLILRNSRFYDRYAAEREQAPSPQQRFARPSVASELARAGLRSKPKAGYPVLPDTPREPIHDRCAAEREQAPSPQQRFALLPVVSELARAGLRSKPKAGYPVLPDTPREPIHDCYAAEREQAPSPQQHFAPPPVASELARAGLRSKPRACYPVLPDTPREPIHDCYAAEREQAPSPQQHFARPSVASELARAGLRSKPRAGYPVLPDTPREPIHDRCAAEREQAPSPQPAISSRSAPEGHALRQRTRAAGARPRHCR